MKRACILILALMVLSASTSLAQGDGHSAEAHTVTYAVYDGDCEDRQAPLLKAGRLVYDHEVNTEVIKEDIAGIEDGIFSRRSRASNSQRASAYVDHDVHDAYVDRTTRVHENSGGGSRCKTYTIKRYYCNFQGCLWKMEETTNIAYHTKNTTTCKNWNPPLY